MALKVRWPTTPAGVTSGPGCSSPFFCWGAQSWWRSSYQGRPHRFRNKPSPQRHTRVPCWVFETPVDRAGVQRSCPGNLQGSTRSRLTLKIEVGEKRQRIGAVEKRQLEPLLPTSGRRGLAERPRPRADGWPALCLASARYLRRPDDPRLTSPRSMPSRSGSRPRWQVDDVSADEISDGCQRAASCSDLLVK
jgi:hypothetical protein